MSLNERILVVDDEANIRKILIMMLTHEGYEPMEARNLFQARAILRENEIHVVLTDLRLEMENGLALLKWIRDERLPCPVIILTAHGTVDSAVDAMKQGAFDYLAKPFDRSELVSVLRKACLNFAYQSQNSLSVMSFPMIGKNEKILKLQHLIEKVAPTDSNVLITGESGTGKELIAQAIHEKNKRSTKPFIKINCAAIPNTLRESELFDYERGAFTGAIATKPGRFELADGGTVFLDEIGEMSPEMQVKLLRVLQDRAFERVGGLRTIQVDVRLVTATNKNLEEEVRVGRFRGDLYYRLNVVPIHLPPLRDRADDIPLLIAHFVKKFCEKLKKDEPTLHPETLDLLIQFPWPGNIRQLENIVERMIVMVEGATMSPEYLPDEVLDYEEQRYLENQASSGTSLKEQVREATRRIERRAIEDALVETSNNVTQAARKLNISRKGLQLKMKELGLR